MEEKSVELNICYNCMRKLDSDAYICPSCGCNNTVRSNPENVLPEGTILFRKYLVGRMIGRGGFGVTYIGYDLDLQLKVAIKEYFPAGVSFRSSKSYDVISESSSAQDHTAFSKGCEAFLDEARMLASVNSLYIVHVRDFFREHGTAYIVMDYVEGQTLPRAMQENGGSLDALRVIRLMLPLIEQLDELHERNIIHRDIKPDNIMLVQDRRGEHLVLLDFGAARSFISGNVSKTYTAVVTPGFAPLEQYSQRSRQGAYTDVYGLCATIYYAITGVIPPTATERSSDDTPIRPFQTYGIAIPETVEAAIMHGLALRSTDRTQTMHELYEELTANTNRNRDTSEHNRNTLKEYTPRYTEQRKSSHAQRTGSTRRKKKKSTSKKAAISLLILCLAVLAGSGIYLFIKRNYVPQPARISAEPEPTTQIDLPDITQNPQHTSEQTGSNIVPRNIRVGDFITFGSYEQDNDLTNGKEPIEWIALEVQDGKIFLLSRYALDCKPFNNLNTATSWPTCSLNSWLNYSFLHSAFTDQEAGCIEDQKKVFLLSRDDVIRYFPNIEDRKCYATEFAKSNGAYVSESEDTTLWWLSLDRKSRNMRAFAPVVDAKGAISSGAVDYKYYTARPAMWIDREKANQQTAKDDRSEIVQTQVGETESPQAPLYVSFGVYEQDNDLTNGKEPIEWQILDVQNDKALLISKFALDCKSYNGSWLGTNWEKCTLRTWLNGTFLNEAFSLEEQSQIKLNDTSDKLFLLSIMEAKHYYSSDGERQCMPTEYALEKECHINQNNGNCWWWLRSQGNNPFHAAKVLSNGSIDELGSSIDYAYNAIRPAVWVDVSVLR